ncbi:hypothetical protein KSF_036820 [Reticulibacter mediterranei]|uniref:Thiol:disulfide interchange protein DsbD N-terminal domain-containing protein n=1 Tax=Reticulibacter mediterranei TaxID=2778369 RepID=A0A8J3ILC7_9CHLR|nr:hypothetical protein KSF_036820 [Reticulibacter mediterranei]
MRIWAKLYWPALILALCLLPLASQPAATQAEAKVPAASVAVVSAQQTSAKPTAAGVKLGSGSEIFVRADLQPDGQYKFVGGLTKDLAGTGVHLSVTPTSSTYLAPGDWRWVDQTYDDMQAVAGYPEVHFTKPLYMAPNEPLEVSLTALSRDADGSVMLPSAWMQLMPCQGSRCPRHMQIDLQVYYGLGGVQETLTTQIAAPHGEELRNGFITYPANPFIGNNQPQRSFPAYGSAGPVRQVSQIVVPYALEQRGIDAYSAEAATATRWDFLPADALASATTDIYAGL